MRILNKLWQYRFDFGAILICEHCGHQAEIDDGYEDSRYLNAVVPSMLCLTCNKNSEGSQLAVEGYGNIGIRTL